jgi:hypothetical protein
MKVSHHHDMVQFVDVQLLVKCDVDSQLVLYQDQPM